MSKREKDIIRPIRMGPMPMVNYDEVLKEFKRHLIDLGASDDIAAWQEIVVHNFLYVFVTEHHYMLVQR